jgi:hypothetical protein
MGSYRPDLARHVLQRDLDRLGRLLTSLSPDDGARVGALAPWLRLVLEATREVGGRETVAPAAWDLLERLEELADAGPGRWVESHARAQDAFEVWRGTLDHRDVSDSPLAQAWLDPTLAGERPAARRFLRLCTLLDAGESRTA